ncbi:relaxase/mobilization nuclease domain-containing protein [Paracidovorax konjaci]|uniref:Relaxase/Mobilisation nuclease domain-containing protein n=1 Tax=Paracidovorax konjaci TaxID=32040 RepID=A0A1I1TWE1_9BURK|nr:relaxase/mobilization nuclease domain-containing protein [Paracidovorax konjaci]SFD62986.1 Relaxase/Mobilisation nuclease domain-containing protein [Paracidovorax konjaci]
MIHVRMPHGQGNALQAARYLMSNQDHAGKTRSVPPVVLDGDPLLVAALANQTHRAHKYVCGCLSFRDSERPTVAQQREIMRDFERTFLPGLQKGQHYAIAWVAHKDKGNLELNYLLATTELTSGKQMNPFPPGDVQHEFNDAWVQNMNHVLGYEQVVADPFKVMRSRFETQVLPLKEATAQICQQASSHRAIRDELQSLFGTAIAQGQLNSRQELIEHLGELGTVTRAGQDYVSFMPTGEQKAIRLKGPMFAAHADYAQLRADHQNRLQARELTEQQFSRNEAKLGRLKQARAAHFQKLYAQPLGQAKPRRYGPKRRGIKATSTHHTRNHGGRSERANLPPTTNKNKNNQEEATMTARTQQRRKDRQEPFVFKRPKACQRPARTSTQSSKVHAHRLLALGIGGMPMQAPLVGALMIQIAMLNVQWGELNVAYNSIALSDPQYAKKRGELYDRIMAVQLALAALTLQANEATFNGGSAAKPKVW